jgi:hypothetical protein
MQQHKEKNSGCMTPFTQMPGKWSWPREVRRALRRTRSDYKKAKATFGGNRCAHYHGCGDGFTGISQSISNCTF